MNNLHYFCSSHHAGNPNIRDAAQIILDEQLNVISSCLIQDSVNVTTQTLLPFSGTVAFQNFSPAFNPINSNLINDYSVVNTCSANSVVFNVTDGCDTTWVTANPSGFANPNYLWSNGEISNTTFVTNSDTLTVQIYDPQSCCTLMDTIALTISSSSMTVNFPSDTVLCLVPGDSYTISPLMTGTIGGEVFTWNTGDITQDIQIDSSGYYFLNVSSSCASVDDSIQVVIHEYLIDQDLPDTSVCSSSLPINLNLPYTIFDSILWSNGETGLTATMNTTGLYSYTVYNYCGFVEDTFSISVTPDFSVMLSADTVLCMISGANLSIIPIVSDTIGGEIYTWNTGQTTQAIQVDSSGQYILNVSGMCTSVEDSIQITVHDYLTNYDISDTSVCSSDFPLIYNLPYTEFDSILWSNGDVGISSNIGLPGQYSYTAYSYCGVEQNTFTVSIIPTVSISDISNIDTCLVIGQSVSFNANSYTSDAHVWSNGSVSSQIDVNQDGSYFLSVSNSCGSDTSFFNVDIEAIPYLNLPSVIDTCLQSGNSIVFDAYTISGFYSWSTGSTESNIIIDSAGIYICTLSNLCGAVSDTIIVNNVTDIELIVPQDTNYFCGDKIELSDLSFVTTGVVYLGDSPNTNNLAYISEGGTYYLTASDGCGTITNSIYIELENSALFYAPNSFTPDGDEYNTLYQFVGDNYIVEEVLIFNRWGELLYEEKGNFSGWDGTYNGEMCADGIYVVVVRIKDCSDIDTKRCCMLIC
ncbi:MAG: gliding motility-associated C-terminal domain-containing protein [Crocinitomicaceae bacterium]|nr:gliding motility-associated C-terminal domain-containing protein [Crocinitomicaceae bacterium]